MASELSCPESQELLALAAVGVLSEADTGLLESHVAGCEQCRAAGRDFQRVAALLPGSLEPIAPPPSLRRRLLSEVYGASRSTRRGRPMAALWQWVPQRRWITVAGACAALAAVALGIWGATRSAQPQEVTYRVVGTTTAPEAAGTLTYFPATQQAVIDVSGLSSPPQTGASAPDVYELWLVPSAGPPRPAAFLVASPLTHTWTAALHGDIAQFVTLAATTEPYGGSPQPTGSQLFSVQLQG